jgi:hypothetical protein
MEISDTFTSVLFFDANQSGAFETDGTLGIGDDGPVLYTGTLAVPVFSTGSYTLDHGALVITNAGVPEPATWTVMLLGIAGLGAQLRTIRRRGAPVAD